MRKKGYYMPETLARYDIAKMTVELAKFHTPSLRPDEPVSRINQENYSAMYRALDRFGKESAGERFFSTVWEIGENHLPVYVASNHHIPDTPQAVRFDMLSLIHGDTVAESEESLRKLHYDDEKIYGPGTCDMKWAAFAGIEGIRHASKDSHVGMIVTPDEESGGFVAKQISEEGIFDNTKMVFIADGAPTEEGTMSLVTAAKGGLRIKVIPSSHLSTSEQLKQRTQFLQEVMETIKTENKRRQQEDPDPWTLPSFNPTYPEHGHPGKTPIRDGVIFNVREENPQYAKKVMERIAVTHGVHVELQESQMRITTVPDRPQVHASAVLTVDHPIPRTNAAVLDILAQVENDGRNPNHWKLMHHDQDYHKQNPGRTDAMLDIRTGKEVDTEFAREIVEELAEKYELQNETTVYIAIYEAHTDRPEWNKFAEIAQRNCRSVRKTRNDGNQDGRHLPDSVTSVVVGVHGGGAHSEDEWASLDSLEKVTRTYVECVKDLT